MCVVRLRVGHPCPDGKRAAGIADIHATEEPGYWTYCPAPNPVAPLRSAALFVAAQLFQVDHARVEEAGLVQRALALLSGDLALLRPVLLLLVRVVRLLLVGAVRVGLLLVGGVGVGLELLLRVLVAVGLRVLRLGLSLYGETRLRGVLVVGDRRVVRLRGLRVRGLLRAPVRSGGGELGRAAQWSSSLVCCPPPAASWAAMCAPSSSVATRPCSFWRPRPTASRVLASTASKAPSLVST